MENNNPSSESAYIQLAGIPLDKKKSVNSKEMAERAKAKEVVDSINNLKSSLKAQILTKEYSWGADSDQINNSIESVAWNFDGTLLAVADWGNSVFICEVKAKENLKVKTRANNFKCGELSWHPAKNLLAFLGKNDKINIFDVLKEGEEATSILNAENQIISQLFIKWHPKQELIAFSIQKDQICISDLQRIIKTIPINFDCLCLNWNNAGDKLAYSGNNNLIVWDYVENNQYLKIKEKNQITCINWSGDDQKISFLSSLGSDKKIKIWNVEEEIEERVFGSVHYDIVSFDWNFEGRFIIAANKDNSFTIWDLWNSFEILSTEPNKENEIRNIKWNPSCTRIVSQMRRQIAVYSWSIQISSDPIQKSFKEKVSKAILSPNENKLLVCFKNNKIRIFNLVTQDEEDDIDILESDFYDAIWYKDSEKIVCLIEENIFFYDLIQKKGKYHDYENENSLRIIRYNNQFTWIAGAGNQFIEIFSIDLENFLIKMEIEAHERNILDVRWNQDGTKLLSASRDKTIKVWNLNLDSKEATAILVIKKHSGFVYSALWNESEKNIISIGADQYIRIFDTENGKEQYSINTQDDEKKDLNWFRVFNQNFLIYLDNKQNSLELIDIKTGLHLKSLSFLLKESKENIIMKNLTLSDEKKIVLFSLQDVLIYDNEKIWHNFESYEYLFYLLDYLPINKMILVEHAKLIEKIVNYFYFNKAPSVFHILCNFKFEEEFEILLRFCLKHKIFPKKFYDDPEYSLLKILNLNKTPSSIMDLFFDFVIESDVPLGNLFEFNCEDILEYTMQNSLKVCNFLKSRFKTVSIDNYNIKNWENDDIKYSSALTSNLDNFIHEKLEFKGVDISNDSTISERNKSNQEEEFISSEKPNFKVLDIPFEKLGLDFILNISKTNSFDEFCKIEVIISTLDILWENGVRWDFIKTNLNYFIYFVVLIANSLVVLPGFLTEIEANQVYFEGDYWIPFLVLNIVLIFLLIAIIYGEILEYRRSKTNYFDSFWNKLDWINIIFSIACIIFNIVILCNGTNEYGWLRVFHSICFFSSMVRIFDFFRAFKETCFLIETVLEVINDMRVFILVMTLFVSTFSFSSK